MQVNHVYCGDSAEVLKRLPDNSVDAVVVDPPYGLSREPNIEEVLTKWLAGEDYEHTGGGFMGKTWDSFVPGPALWREVRRVVKPGGHILCFAGTRTVDLMGIALRLGGWEIRDTLQWLYGTGFPKSHDISKAIDKQAGAEREKIRVPATEVRNPKSIESGHGIDGGDRPWMRKALEVGYHEKDGNTPVTPEAQQWDGWGTALKPAHEPIVLARKPLSERTVADNVLKWGTGGLNIDGCRIGTEQMGGYVVKSSLGRRTNEGGEHKDFIATSVTGRFPANVLLDEEAAAMLDEQSGEGRSTVGKVRGGGRSGGIMGKHVERSDKGLPYGYNDFGGASRFFYVAKASKKERTHNGKVENNHPTVKPIKLMEYLIRLITPPGGIVLDPFCGSGSTLLAARNLGFSYIGIDREQEYVELTNQRLQATAKGAD